MIRLVPMGKKLKETFQDVLLEERLAKEERIRRAEDKARQEEIQKRLEAAEQEEQSQERIQQNIEALE